METIINTIIKRQIKKTIIAQRLGIYTSLDDVINSIFKELEQQRVVISELHKQYIKQQVQKKLQHKLKK